ncbi:MAG: Kef family K(+) transporter [Hyphomicrobium sp.]|jgi:CPA2 family monovalent cation:H+ antiporter-2|uniref:YbaL family putative K(+) efflux transporter n=1 Tax=Hyphomicrobium sp. TaxID=82 RepID=UPI0025C0AA81|nr:YbaL family putative K(+) efflux transporter [Hyphomicrobium sp.]MBX9864780.1 Kef family K(+) transporter [Hyphomicrobium sp.]
MPHSTPLIATIVTGLALAFVFGALAHRLRISPLVGYLVAGIAIGPFTPGFIADQGLANELAEIGVILLMFGVGLHFSMKELWAVRNIAVPGAVVQIAVATLLGAALGHALGWTAGGGLVFGLALSVASTVVLLRALQERRLVTTERGQIAVGWLIVEDLVMVLTLVLLPAIAPLLGGNSDGQPNGGGSSLDINQLLMTVAFTIGKVAAFVALMMVAGRRIIPWILHYTAHTGSRELFRLAVLSIALGVAFIAANLFGVSFALGAFFAGLVLSESQLSQQAANESLPLRDAFAVLFFVSVGMLFDPNILVEQPLAVLATVLIIVIGKSLAALAIVRAFGHPMGTAFTISASLAQIGEFSFILAALGVSLELLPPSGRDLILAGALISIILNPAFFSGLDRLKPWLEKKDGTAEAAHTPEEAEEESAPIHVTTLEGHTIVVGIGRVGKRITDILASGSAPLYVIDESDEEIKRLHARGIEGVSGSAATLLYAANPAKAASLIVAIPSNFEAGQVIEQARAANADVPIIGRAQSEAEADYLRRYGATHVVLSSDTIADALVAAYRKSSGT